MPILERILPIVGACTSIVGLFIEIWIVSKSKRIVTGLVGIGLLIIGITVFVYLYKTVPESVIPPLTISLDSLTVTDTQDQVKVLPSDQIINIRSLAEHVKLHIVGQAEGADLSRFKGQLSAYVLVRPPTEKEIWYVQLRERGSVTESGRFDVEAYLGGIGKYSAQEGQIFGIAIAILDFQPQATYDSLMRIPTDRPISNVYTVRVNRGPN